MIAKSPPAGAKGEIEFGGTGITKASPPERPTSEPVRETKRERYTGLCTTCTHAPDCTFPRSVDRPVMFCEEFDGVVKAEVKPPLAVERLPLSERSAVVDRDRFSGLCMTCEKRETCTFPKPDGGVLHCEEFE